MHWCNEAELTAPIKSMMGEHKRKVIISLYVPWERRQEINPLIEWARSLISWTSAVLLWIENKVITLDEYNQITFKHFVHKLNSIRMAITCN